ncbi:nesprin-1 [Caerostris extrusa]|uniref:Nesprin-1 n=1 Tax=Caerostris extrusa TaxID=172846 RepID=A0AAV4P5H6_CAEEX|nr:nesprin-1 [Caerostris extrusa]
MPTTSAMKIPIEESERLDYPDTEKYQPLNKNGVSPIHQIEKDSANVTIDFSVTPEISNEDKQLKTSDSSDTSISVAEYNIELKECTKLEKVGDSTSDLNDLKILSANGAEEPMQSEDDLIVKETISISINTLPDGSVQRQVIDNVQISECHPLVTTETTHNTFSVTSSFSVSPNERSLVEFENLTKLEEIDKREIFEEDSMVQMKKLTKPEKIEDSKLDKKSKITQVQHKTEESWKLKKEFRSKDTTYWDKSCEYDISIESKSLSKEQKSISEDKYDLSYNSSKDIDSEVHNEPNEQRKGSGDKDELNRIKLINEKSKECTLKEETQIDSFTSTKTEDSFDPETFIKPNVLHDVPGHSNIDEELDINFKKSTQPEETQDPSFNKKKSKKNKRKPKRNGNEPGANDSKLNELVSSAKETVPDSISAQEIYDSGNEEEIQPDSFATSIKAEDLFDPEVFSKPNTLDDVSDHSNINEELDINLKKSTHPEEIKDPKFNKKKKRKPKRGDELKTNDSKLNELVSSAKETVPDSISAQEVYDSGNEEEIQPDSFATSTKAKDLLEPEVFSEPNTLEDVSDYSTINKELDTNLKKSTHLEEIKDSDLNKKKKRKPKRDGDESGTNDSKLNEFVSSAKETAPYSISAQEVYDSGNEEEIQPDSFATSTKAEDLLEPEIFCKPNTLDDVSDHSNINEELDINLKKSTHPEEIKDPKFNKKKKRKPKKDEDDSIVKDSKLKELISLSKETVPDSTSVQDVSDSEDEKEIQLDSYTTSTKIGDLLDPEIFSIPIPLNDVFDHSSINEELNINLKKSTQPEKIQEDSYFKKKKAKKNKRKPNRDEDESGAKDSKSKESVSFAKETVPDSTSVQEVSQSGDEKEIQPYPATSSTKTEDSLDPEVFVQPNTLDDVSDHNITKELDPNLKKSAQLEEVDDPNFYYKKSKKNKHKSKSDEEESIVKDSKFKDLIPFSKQTVPDSTSAQDVSDSEDALKYYLPSEKQLMQGDKISISEMQSNIISTSSIASYLSDTETSSDQKVFAYDNTSKASPLLMEKSIHPKEFNQSVLSSNQIDSVKINEAKLSSGDQENRGTVSASQTKQKKNVDGEIFPDKAVASDNALEASISDVKPFKKEKETLSEVIQSTAEPITTYTASSLVEGRLSSQLQETKIAMDSVSDSLLKKNQEMINLLSQDIDEEVLEFENDSVSSFNSLISLKNSLLDIQKNFAYSLATVDETESVADLLVTTSKEELGLLIWMGKERHYPVQFDVLDVRESEIQDIGTSTLSTTNFSHFDVSQKPFYMQKVASLVEELEPLTLDAKNTGSVTKIIYQYVLIIECIQHWIEFLETWITCISQLPADKHHEECKLIEQQLTRLHHYFSLIIEFNPSISEILSSDVKSDITARFVNLQEQLDSTKTFAATSFTQVSGWIQKVEKSRRNLKI